VVYLLGVFVVGPGFACVVDILEFLVGKPQRTRLLQRLTLEVKMEG
jgi:hypothetical protein